MKLIKLTQNRFTKVDDELFNSLNKYHWSVSNGYAERGTSKGGPRSYKMHRVIIDAKEGEEVDHIDGDRLNNQKNNLRIVSRTQNQMNRKINKNNKSGYKGVTWCNRSNKWIAQIRVDTKTKFIGYYLDPKEAGIAYNKKAEIYFGRFAKLNKICK